MESLPFYNEDTLLEEYEEAMECEVRPVVSNPAIDCEESPNALVVELSGIHIDAPEKIVVAAPEASLPTSQSDLVSAVASNAALPTDQTALSPKNTDLISDATGTSGSNKSTTPLSIAVVKCRVCGSSHPLASCRKFRFMTNEKRLRMVLLHRYCSRCLSPHHLARDCKSTGKCGKCQEKHNSMLHSSGKSTIKKKAKNLVRSSVQPMASAPIRHFVSFSPTVRVNLEVFPKTIPLRAVIDLCCSMSYVCEDLVKALKLPVSSMGSDKICRLKVNSIHDSSQHVMLTVKVRQMKGIKTPVETVSDLIKENFAGMQLADPNFNQSLGVGLVIGPEVAPQILKGRIYSNPGFPLAQYTIFGWVISGQSPY